MKSILIGLAPLILLAQDPNSRQSGQDDEQPPITSLTLKDGKQIRARIMKVEGSRVRLLVQLSGGHAGSWQELSKFKPHSLYRIKRSQVPVSDVQGRLDLAAWCAKQKLVPAARAELRTATRAFGEIDKPDPAQRLRWIEQAVDVLDSVFGTLAKSGKISEARRGVSSILIRYPDALSEVQKNRLLDTIASVDRARKAAAVAKREASGRKKLNESRERMLVPLRKSIENGKKLRKKGLLNSKYFGKASSYFRQAVKQFESAYKKSQQIKKKMANDGIAMAEVDALIQDGKIWWIDSLLNEASLHLTRGQFNRAMANVNRILAVDATNGRALSMRARIEVAANEWGIGGNNRL